MSSGISFPAEQSVALDRDQWMQIATDLMEVGPIIQAAFVQIKENTPEAGEIYAALDPVVFEADIRAACAAIAWVAEFAPDKCRFILEE